VSQIFWGRVKLESAFAFYFFSKGGTLQTLIHEIKYHGGKELAYELGIEFGHDLIQEGYGGLYNFICPIPLHKQKQRLRGYNQSEWLARGIAQVLDIEVENNIVSRKVFTSTQTKKNRQQRWENVKDAFQVVDIEKLKGKHVLLLDDVIKGKHLIGV